MNYWLLKSDPDAFSWADLAGADQQTTGWEGVRNYQARNFLRRMHPGDLALFYHSAVSPQVIPGIVRIIRRAYPDPTQYQRESPYFDPNSPLDNPRWMTVDIRLEQELVPPITRDELKRHPELAGMMLLQKGSRLSVQPVTVPEWEFIMSLRRQGA